MPKTNKKQCPEYKNEKSKNHFPQEIKESQGFYI